MPQLHVLRAQAPVHKGRVRELLGLPHHDRHVFAKGRQHYTVLTYEACEAAFRDPQTFSNTVQGHPNPANENTMGILEMDPPMHRAYRRTIQPKFLMPEAMGWWRTRTIDGIVERLIDRMATGRPGRAQPRFLRAHPGLHDHHRDRARRRRGAALPPRLSQQHQPEPQGDDGGPHRATRRIVEDTLLGLIAARRAEPRDDLISFLLKTKLMMPGEEPRPLTDREIMTHAKLVMVAGGGTSWRQMGITLFALLTHRDQFEDVKADRALIGDAIEEGLRWNPTAPYFYRMVMNDTEFYGHADRRQVRCSSSASARPTAIPRAGTDPDRFDIHREKLTNMAFGLGTHRCLGMNVARVEIETGINALLDAFPKLRLDPGAEAPFMTGGLEQQGVSGLPVLLR